MYTMRSLLLWILQKLYPPEQLTDTEWIAYRKQQEARQTEPIPLYVPECEVHKMMRLERIGSGLYRCPLCQQFEDGPHTDPTIQNVAKSLYRQPHPMLKAYNVLPGSSPHSKMLKAVTAVDMAKHQAKGERLRANDKAQYEALQRKMQERDALREKERQG